MGQPAVPSLQKMFSFNVTFSERHDGHSRTELTLTTGALWDLHSWVFALSYAAFGTAPRAVGAPPPKASAVGAAQGMIPPSPLGGVPGGAFGVAPGGVSVGPPGGVSGGVSGGVPVGPPGGVSVGVPGVPPGGPPPRKATLPPEVERPVLSASPTSAPALPSLGPAMRQSMRGRALPPPPSADLEALQGDQRAPGVHARGAAMQQTFKSRKPAAATPPPAKPEGREWYHGSMDRRAAEHALRQLGFVEGSFVLRDTSSNPNGFALSIVSGGR